MMKKDVLTYTFVRLREKLLIRADRILHDREAAEDVLQDAFLKLWSRDYGDDEPEATEKIVTAVVRNASVDRMRRAVSRGQGRMPGGNDVAIAQPPGESYQEIVREKYLRVKEIVEHDLTEGQRRIIRMKEYEGMDYGEISEALGMEETAVRMQVSRARKAVREIYRTKVKNYGQYE